MRIFVCTPSVYFIAIVCHPFFVFGQHEVASFEPPTAEAFTFPALDARPATLLSQRVGTRTLSRLHQSGTEEGHGSDIDRSYSRTGL